MTKELHAGLKIVENVREKKWMKESIAAKIVFKIREAYKRSNKLRKQNITQTLEGIDPEIVVIKDITVNEGIEQQAKIKKRVQFMK